MNPPVSLNEPVAPFLRWAGSKRKLIPRLRELLPSNFERYVEPFAGSACLFFAVLPPHALLADFNSPLINAYLTVAKSPTKLAKRLTRFGTTSEDYYLIREKILQSTTDFESAARFIYLNSYCFNGVYRTNKKGEFNVPRGSKTAGVPSAARLIACSKALRAAEVKCQDYTETLSECVAGDFVYLDPPYTKNGVRNRGEYGAGSFTADDENLLIASLRRLSKKRIRFLLSYRASSQFIQRLAPEWQLSRFRVRRNVAGFSGSRRSAMEILVRNFG